MLTSLSKTAKLMTPFVARVSPASASQSGAIRRFNLRKFKFFVSALCKYYILFVVKTITHFIFITPFCSFTCSVNFPQFSYYTLFEWIVYYFHSFVVSTLMINTFLFFAISNLIFAIIYPQNKHTHTLSNKNLYTKHSKYRRIPSQRSHG